jgi:TnpA family transposase
MIRLTRFTGSAKRTCADGEKFNKNPLTTARTGCDPNDKSWGRRIYAGQLHRMP